MTEISPRAEAADLTQEAEPAGATAGVDRLIYQVVIEPLKTEAGNAP